MKKPFIILILIFGIINTAYSQETRFAAKLGYNASYLGGDTGDKDPEINSGFHLGGLWDIPFSNSFSLQPELLFSFEVYEYGTNYSSLKANSSYFRMPVLAKLSPLKGWSIEAGPVAGFLIASKMDGRNVKDSFHLFDVAVAAGTTFEFNNGLFFSARYNLGLVDMNKSESYNLKNHGNSIQASIGYFIQL